MSGMHVCESYMSGMHVCEPYMLGMHVCEPYMFGTCLSSACMYVSHTSSWGRGWERDGGGWGRVLGMMGGKGRIVIITIMNIFDCTTGGEGLWDGQELEKVLMEMTGGKDRRVFRN